MAQNNQEEIDLLFFFKKFNQLVRKGIVSIFKGLRFVRKYWIVILILIAAGIAYGYYVESKAQPSQKASMLVRINFNAVNNVYSIVNNMNNKIAGGGLAKTGVAEDDKELDKVGGMEFTPIVNVQEILDRYDYNDRRLEGIVKNLDFEFDEEGEFADLSATFRNQYRYHYLDVALSHSANPGTLDKLIEHINSNPLLKEVKTTGIKSLEERLDATKETIEQINMVLESYAIKETQPYPNTQLYVVDKNFNISEIFKNKVALQKELEALQSDLVYAKDVIVNVTEPTLFVETSFFSNKKVLYPLLFVFIFFGLAFLRSSYFSLKRIAEEEISKE